jgi:hypothetical protein
MGIAVVHEQKNFPALSLKFVVNGFHPTSKYSSSPKFTLHIQDLADFPLISRTNFPPVAMQPLPFYPPPPIFLLPIFTINDLSGGPRKNRPVSPKLKTS